MIPWSYRWRAWVMGRTWIYEKLWRNHWCVVILAGLGILFLFHLAVEHGAP